MKLRKWLLFPLVQKTCLLQSVSQRTYDRMLSGCFARMGSFAVCFACELDTWFMNQSIWGDYEDQAAGHMCIQNSMTLYMLSDNMLATFGQSLTEQKSHVLCLFLSSARNVARVRIPYLDMTAQTDVSSLHAYLILLWIKTFVRHRDRTECGSCVGSSALIIMSVIKA